MKHKPENPHTPKISTTMNPSHLNPRGLALFIIILSLAFPMLLHSHPPNNDKGESGGAKENSDILITWRYAGNRGGLPVGWFDTVYYFNGVEVGTGKDGISQIIERLKNTKNVTAVIRVWPSVNVGPVDKIPDLLSQEMPKLINLSKIQNIRIIIDPTKHMERDKTNDASPPFSN